MLPIKTKKKMSVFIKRKKTTKSKRSARRPGQLISPLDSANYIVFDFETTGGNPERNGITEIFAIRFSKGRQEDTFYSLVNPG